jgi:alpha-beta hydrolase superfamily lysophospholipase
MGRPMLEAFQRGITSINKAGPIGRLPLLWLHGTADALVGLDDARVGIELIKGDVLEVHHYEGGMHENFNEINADDVLARTTAFLDRHLPPARATDTR